MNFFTKLKNKKKGKKTKAAKKKLMTAGELFARISKIFGCLQCLFYLAVQTKLVLSLTITGKLTELDPVSMLVSLL